MLKFALMLALLVLAGAANVVAQVSSNWVTVKTAGEGFSVSMPAKPDETTDRTAMLGKNYQMRMYVAVDPPTGVVYMALMQELAPAVSALGPSVKMDEFMKGFRQGFVESMNKSGTKVDMEFKREFDLKGHQGRHYFMLVGDKEGFAQAFDGGNRIYMLIVVGATEQDANATRFIKSFEILPAPAPVPT